MQVYFYVNSKISENGYFLPLEKTNEKISYSMLHCLYVEASHSYTFSVYFCSANCTDFVCVVSYQIGIFCFPGFNKMKFFHVSFCKHMFTF